MKFLSPKQVTEIINRYDSPVFVMSREVIEKQCKQVLSMPNLYGLTARYAVKANPNLSILKIIDATGMHFDASSEYEIIRLKNAGISTKKIQFTGQEMPRHFLKDFIQEGGFFNASSLHQLEEFGKKFSGHEVSVRLNPGIGSGGTKKTNVGGKTASFGIWHEYTDKITALINKYNLKLTKIHSHIGSGADPAIWRTAADLTLQYVKNFKDVHTVNLGGGFKVARTHKEKSTDLHLIGKEISHAFAETAKTTGRELHLEIEPGTFITANAGVLIAQVDDVIDTGKNGYNFIKINAGMDNLTRPALYGSEHPITILSDEHSPEGEFVIAGHCCESGDIFTVNDEWDLIPRTFKTPKISDPVIISGAGAYSSSMSLKNYNSFPEVAEILLDLDGKYKLIRKPQKPEQIWANEIHLE